MSAREEHQDLIAQQVLERSRFRTAEDVRKLASLANAERQFGREYHGRFVIELLQNAADAWRRLAGPNERSRVRIILGEGPSLIVANQGEVLSAETIIRSLGHIGASTKPHGEAIGHKGIGFKSVLEMTLSPEVYSDFRDGDFEVAVRFDPVRALSEIRSGSPGWDEFLSDVIGLSGDPLEPIPALQFPFRVDSVPDEVLELARDGFTTMVRLVFESVHSQRLHLDAQGWEDTVRRALNDVTDEIVLLLDMFDEVVLDDRLGGSLVHISQSAEEEPRLLDGRVQTTQPVMQRNGTVSSRWRLYRETFHDGTLLEGEIVVGVPLTHDATAPHAINTSISSRPFHLFFPTRIASATPFLLHGYFEVAAGRASFYGGSEDQNRLLLDRLSALIGQAIADVATSDIDLAALAHLLGDAPVPEDPLAQWFRDKTLAALDNVAWVPTRLNEGVPHKVRPAEGLAFKPGSLARRLSNAFDAGYIWKSVHAAALDDAIDEVGLDYLADRRARDETNPPDLWTTVRTLLRPGDLRPWEKGQEDEGFVGFLELLALLDATDRARTRAIVAGLRGDQSARLIPVVASDGARELVPPSSRAESGRGRRQLILARLREREAGELVPPAELQVSFIADQLLDARLLAGPGSLLGVQEYVVDSVLDRLEGVALNVTTSRAVVDFMWRLLVREERSAFGLKRSLPDMSVFEPGRWFWFHLGRSEGSEADRQRRERGLASLPLPSRSGAWIPASQLAFGQDWAEWFESGAVGPATAPTRQRAAAYRDLEQLAPSPDRLLASPHQITSLLADIALWEDGWSEALGEDHRCNLVRHGFLLRLGVWEVPPVKVFLERRDRTDERIPWPGRLRDRLLDWVAEHGGWVFDYATYEHTNVTIGEDYRFDWSFQGHDPEALARSIARGTRLYEQLATLFAFCPGCHSHRTRYKTTASDVFPSRLSLQLRHEAWVPCVRDGRDIVESLPATVAWWDPAPPERASIQQSPLRYLSIVRPGTPLSEPLRQLADLPQLSTARPERIERLLLDLRKGYLSETLDPDPRRSSLTKQAFVGIHRLAYRRLGDLSMNSSEQVSSVLDTTQVLCDIGNALDFKPPSEARHDDGRFAAYRRFFAGKVPFAVLARDQEAIARRLGIRPFEVELIRRDSGQGTDVSEEVANLVGDRAVEFLAIVVNHSLGTQTLELGSEQFHERARRLLRLRVVQVEQLVLDAVIVGTQVRASIGEQADFDVFLDGPTSSQPILYHDLKGDGWQDRLRRKLASNIAAVLENPNYAATFTLFLQQETDAEREEFLLELGITAEDVDAVRSALGVVSEADRLRRRIWFAAIVYSAGVSASDDDGEEDEEQVLVAAGLDPDLARRLVELGGGHDVRTNVGPQGALGLLVDSGVSLASLHEALVARGDPGLVIRTASDRLRDWKTRYGRRVVAVLATKVTDAEAKVSVENLSPDPGLKFVLDPDKIDVLAPVIEALCRVGLDPDRQALASEDPTPELARLAMCVDAAELDRRVLLLFDAEERGRILRGLAHDWRRELRLIGVLFRASAHEPRSVTRLHAEKIEALLPPNPERPTVLRTPLPALLPGATGLEGAIASLLVDEVTASPPDRREIGPLLRQHGLDPAPLDEIERVLAMPARTEARRLRSQIDQLVSQAVQVAPPVKRIAPSRTPAHKSSVVRTIHVGGSERRRRRVGEEGERWALAAVIQPLLDPPVRQQALPDIVALLRNFEGEPVERALAHVDAVTATDLDDEELIDELTGLLHVARYSDDFGFDLLAWLPPIEGADPTAMCLEVKSSGNGTFHFSSGEWARATQLREEGLGDRYAILVVRRQSGAAPERLDLLVDPVTQCDQGLLTRRDDGYVMAY